MAVALIDYNMGNLKSVEKALEFIGAKVRIAEKPRDLAGCSCCILPGVGNFGDGMENLRSSGFDRALPEFISGGGFFFGICLGMQMLLESSEEAPGVPGLGVFPGRVMRFPAGTDKVPHMGWNSLQLTEKGKKHPLFKYSKEGDYVYFVHSFYGKDCDESLLATSEYGIPVTASAANENVMGCQFHPEKSGEVGLRILKAFSEI